jgi:hypothetical protein
MERCQIGRLPSTRKPAHTRPQPPTAGSSKSIRAARPDGAPIYVILDNLSANKSAKTWAWAARNKVELCFTPTYVSWANPIEAQFGPLRSFVIAGWPSTSQARPGIGPWPAAAGRRSPA